MRKLTPKQRAFVDAYTGEARGNATEAARMAGYRGNDTTLGSVGAENLTKPAIRNAISAATAETRQRAVMTRAERQEFLTEAVAGNDLYRVAKGPPGWKERLKALEILARMQGDMLDVDAIRERLRELKPRMSSEAYRELLLALKGDR